MNYSIKFLLLLIEYLRRKKTIGHCIVNFSLHSRIFSQQRYKSKFNYNRWKLQCASLYIVAIMMMITMRIPNALFLSSSSYMHTDVQLLNNEIICFLHFFIVCTCTHSSICASTRWQIVIVLLLWDIKGDLWSEVVNNVPRCLHYKLYFCENVKTREKEKPLRLQPFMGTFEQHFCQDSPLSS